MKGIHNQRMTTEIIEFLEQQGFEIEDVSYKNDACDSIVIKNRILMLPNSIIDDSNEEKFNTFFISTDSEGNFEYNEKIDSLYEVVVYFNNVELDEKAFKDFVATKVEMTKTSFSSVYGEGIVEADKVLVYVDSGFIEVLGAEKYSLAIYNNYYESNNLAELEWIFWRDFAREELS